VTFIQQLCIKVYQNRNLDVRSSQWYFPVRNQQDGTWKRRMKALKNKLRVESDVIAVASTNSMTHVYNFYRECQAEYYRQR